MRYFARAAFLLGVAGSLAAPAIADVSGMVFRDVDGDGINDGGVESGVDGIAVQAFDAASNVPVATATTAAGGAYNLVLGAGNYRVEFVIPLALNHFQPGANLSGSGNTSVVFAADGAINVDFGVINPGQFCQADPTLAVNCYLKGPQGAQNNPGDDVLISFPYAAGCVDEDQNGVCDAGDVDTPLPTEVAIGSEIGTTWGMAYHRESDSLFVTAFQKRHSGFRASGDTGLIYRISSASTAPAVSDYADFDLLGIPTADSAAFPATGGDPHPAPADVCTSALTDGDPGSTNNNCWLHDTDSYGPVGQIAFGDMDISDDGSTLWTINLFDNTLYSIPVQNVAVVLADVGSFALPTPACVGALEPFAVGFEDGLVYVGQVCNGPTVADLRAYVHSFDPDDVPAGFTLRLSEPLNYTRGLVVDSGGATISAAWNPWSDNPADVFGPVFGTERGLPQPWLTDIDFDDGDLILGIRDRFADMSGFDDGSPDNASSAVWRGDAAGDVLRACANGSNWDFESNANCSGVTTLGSGNGQGPGGGEYYFEERLTTIHDEVTLGGLYQVPINTEVAVSVYDPLNFASFPDVFSGGIHWYRRSDGQVGNLYRIFLRTNPDTFGKAGGLGDIEGFCDAAPLEIGNRVWSDADLDGVQDPGELGLSGVTVELFEDLDGSCDGGDDVLVGSVVSSPTGDYIFTDADVAGGLQFNTNYCLRVAIPVGFGATVLDATPVGDGEDDIRDSDGDVTPQPGSVVTSFTTGGPGGNRHLYDFGFRALEFDWGDLPDGPYPTLAASNGPNHETTSVGNCFLGGAPDNETDGQPGAQALGDDNDLNGDDEDGVLFLTPLNPGNVADIQVTSSGVCVLNAWIDFNSDGDFLDPGEQIANDLALVAGINLLDNVAVPADAALTMAARFRVTNLVGQGGDSPTGGATTGEVEDYALACIGDFVWNDSLNGDGVQDVGELGIVGVVVNLMANDGLTPITDGAGNAITAVTDANGNYKFPGLPTLGNSGLPDPGDYRIRFDRPAPFADFSPADVTTDDLDSDAAQGGPIEGITPIISVVEAENNVDVDAALRAVTAALITSAAAYADHGEIVFEFSTGYEALSAGFELYRRTDHLGTGTSGEHLLVSEHLIPALVGSPQGGVYRVVDRSAPLSGSLSYVIVEHQADGKTQAYGPYTVEVGERGERSSLQAGYATSPHVSKRFAERKARAAAATLRTPSTRSSRQPALQSLARSAATLSLDVRGSGLYQVSSSDVAEVAGLPISRVRRMISDGLIAIETGGEPVAWTRADRSGSALFFYGEAIDSLYTLDNVYRLHLNGQGTQMGRTVGTLPTAAPGGVFTSTEHFEQDVTPLINATLETEVDHWYWDAINAENATTVSSFDVVVPDAVAGTARITAGFAGATDGGAANDHHAIVRINGVEVGTAAWGGIARFEQTFDFDGALLTPLTTIEIEGVLADGSTASIFFIDAFDIEYQRHYQAIDDALLITGDGNKVVTVEELTTADVAIFDISEPRAPVRVHRVRVELTAGGFQASFVPAAADTPYLATTESAVFTGANLRLVAPAVDLRATHHDTQHLVIAPEAWRPEAEALAAYRSGTGMSSLAISIEDVYDAFSDGIVTPWAIRDLLDYAGRNWAQAPDYVLLAGRGTLDPRDLLGGGDNFIPVVLVGTPYGLIATDNVLADLEGDDAVPEIAFGRLPIISPDELAIYTGKLDAYDGSTGDWRGRALLLADNEDSAGDFPLQSDAVAELLTSYEQELVYLSEMTPADARAALQTAWNDGVQLVNYVGHGGVTLLAAEALLTVADADLLLNGDRLPIVSALTCIAGRSDIPNLESLAESLVVATEGGAIAVWAPTGLSLSGAAHELNVFYVQALEAAAAETPLGDVVLETLRAFSVAGGADEMLHAYSIVGDPAVVLP